MKRFAVSAAVAFAMANLYLLFLTGPLVSPQHQLIFHLPGSATALFVPVLLDLLIVFVLFTAVLFWARRHPRGELFVWAALLLPLPWVAFQTVASFNGTPAPLWLLWSAVFLAFAGALLVVLQRRLVMPPFRRLRRILTTVLSFVALSGAVIVGQLVWLGWKSRDLNRSFVPRAAVRFPAGVQAARPHVVWIILDELSYRQVYGHRSPGLALPNFDRLAAQATIFSDVSAAATYTRIAVPSLLTGKAVNATVPSSDGQSVLLHLRGQKGWHPLQPADTVFGDAAAAGLPTAAAGWYEPYCRLLPQLLNDCFWTYSDNIPGGLSGEASLVSNAAAPLRQAAFALSHRLGLTSGKGGEDAADVTRHERDYRALLDAGDRLLTEENAGLVLLHMPIPHPWGFYDRRTGQFPGHRTSYLDNLALADAYLGHLREVLDAHGGWDNADILIMGDHGWRTGEVWRRSGFWTSEEEAASRGAAATDPPALLLKLHGQGRRADISTPFDAVRTRSLIDALLARRLTTAADLQQWVSGGLRP